MSGLDEVMDTVHVLGKFHMMAAMLFCGATERMDIIEDKWTGAEVVSTLGRFHVATYGYGLWRTAEKTPRPLLYFYVRPKQRQWAEYICWRHGITVYQPKYPVPDALPSGQPMRAWTTGIAGRNVWWQFVFILGPMLEGAWRLVKALQHARKRWTKRR